MRSAKWLMSMGMSSRRSRRRWHVYGHHVEAIVEILAEVPVLDLAGHVLVRRGDDSHVHVDGLGTSHARHDPGLEGPENLGLCVERHVADFVEEERAPRGPARTFPARSATAPVNEPFIWPKSADSMSSDGIAAQLTSTKSSSARVESRWIARATSSFPVPFSPVISTRASVGDTLSTRSSTF